MGYKANYALLERKTPPKRGSKVNYATKMLLHCSTMSGVEANILFPFFK